MRVMVLRSLLIVIDGTSIISYVRRVENSIMDLSIKEVDQTGSLTALYVESSANRKHRVDIIVSLSHHMQRDRKNCSLAAQLFISLLADPIATSRKQKRLSHGLGCSMSSCQLDTRTV